MVPPPLPPAPGDDVVVVRKGIFCGGLAEGGWRKGREGATCMRVVVVVVVDEPGRLVVFRFLVGETEIGDVRLGWLFEERLLWGWVGASCGLRWCRSWKWESRVNQMSMMVSPLASSYRDLSFASSFG